MHPSVNAPYMSFWDVMINTLLKNLLYAIWQVFWIVCALYYCITLFYSKILLEMNVSNIIQQVFN